MRSDSVASQTSQRVCGLPLLRLLVSFKVVLLLSYCMLADAYVKRLQSTVDRAHLIC